MQIDTNKMMINGIFTMNDKHTQHQEMNTTDYKIRQIMDQAC